MNQVCQTHWPNEKKQPFFEELPSGENSEFLNNRTFDLDINNWDQIDQYKVVNSQTKTTIHNLWDEHVDKYQTGFYLLNYLIKYDIVN